MSRGMTFEGDSDFDFDEVTWPREVGYDPSKHSSNNAHRFLAARPDRLIVSDGDLYSLDHNNVWRAMTDAELMREIRATDSEIRLDVNKVGNMVREIKIARNVTARPFEWTDEPDDAPSPNDLILASNGIFNFATGRLMDLTGDYFATGVPSWAYDPTAKCPTWLAKLDEWLHPSYHATLQEFFGYLLTPDTSYGKLLALIGASRGGKGTVTRVAEALVGIEHRASVMLNDLSGEFGLAGMIDKRMIVIPDAHDADLSKRSSAIERIKSITGNDPVSVNRKNKAMLTTVRIPAKIVLVANKHPKFLDESGALAIRELMIMFERSFAGREDIGLEGKLTAELSGIANWAIAGLKRLRVQRHFTVGDHGIAAQADLAEHQSPALRFANECMIVTGKASDMLPLTLAFAAYEHWAVYSEALTARERRNKADFKSDVMAALRAHGVGYAQNQVRWHDPHKPRQREGERVKRRFTGVKLKWEFHPDVRSDGSSDFG
jgi:P4 family phage/plasmid primase-like protien